MHFLESALNKSGSLIMPKEVAERFVASRTKDYEALTVRLILY